MMWVKLRELDCRELTPPPKKKTWWGCVKDDMESIGLCVMPVPKGRAVIIWEKWRRRIKGATG